MKTASGQGKGGRSPGSAYVGLGLILLVLLSGYAAYRDQWVAVLVAGLLMVILGLGSLSFSSE